MNKSQKIILLSLVPAFIAVVFLLYVLVPCFTEFNATKEKLNAKNAEIKILKVKAQQSQENKKLYEEIQKIAIQLGDFDQKVPKNKDIEILLIDLEKFAADSNLKITSMEAKNPVVMDLVDPIKSKSKKKSSRKSKQIAALSLLKIPTEIEVNGYYPDVIKFVGKLEKYQRLISIDGVSAKNSQKTADKGTSKVTMQISTNIFIQKENPIPDEEEAKDEKTDAKEDK